MKIDWREGGRVCVGVGLKHDPDKARSTADGKAIDVATSSDDDVMLR